MSFWSWIGLADYRQVQDLQAKCAVLQEENKKLTEEKYGLMVRYLEEANRLSIATATEQGDRLARELATLRAEETAILQELSHRIENQMTTAKEEYEGAQNGIAQLTELVKSGFSSSEAILENCEKRVEKTVKRETKEMQSYIEEAGRNQEQAIQEKIEELYKQISSDSDRVTKKLDDLTLQMCALANAQDTSKKQVEQIAKTLSDVQEVKETLYNLWEIMKAVWVDSLVDLPRR